MLQSSTSNPPPCSTLFFVPLHNSICNQLTHDYERRTSVVQHGCWRRIVHAHVQTCYSTVRCDPGLSCADYRREKWGVRGWTTCLSRPLAELTRGCVFFQRFCFVSISWNLPLFFVFLQIAETQVTGFRNLQLLDQQSTSLDLHFRKMRPNVCISRNFTVQIWSPWKRKNPKSCLK